MTAEGFTSDFPMKELSLMGFLEIVPHIPRLKKRIRETVQRIKSLKPDMVITIDSPGFNNRVVRQLQVIRNHTKLVHYVAPTVWAYKPGRAKKLAARYDHLLTILPFEAPYFEREGLATTFVGHPIIEEPLTVIKDRKQGRAGHNIAEEATVIGVMPGSRHTELQRLLPIFKETLSRMHEHIPDLHAIIFATQDTKDYLASELASWRVSHSLTSGQQEKYALMQCCDIALAKSGTGTLEFARLGIPMVVAYKVNPLTGKLIQRMIRIDYVNLVNIILNTPAIPELLLEQCNPDSLHTALNELVKNPEARTAQQQAMHDAITQLHAPAGETPSALAAKTILGL